MMNLKTTIVNDIKIAMKEKNVVKRDILRVLKGDIERLEQGPKGKVDISDAEIIRLVKKTIQGIKDTDNNVFEIEILEEYLPKQLTEEQVLNNVSSIIEQLDATSMKDMGKVMGMFNNKYNGMADGKLVSTIVKNKLK